MTGDNCFRINLDDALNRLPGPQGEKSVALFEHGSIVIKLYTPQGTDPQTPHSRDEVYVVARGTGDFFCGGERKPFAPHDVLFVAAGLDHRFENFTADFAVWVIFYGPESGEVDRG